MSTPSLAGDQDLFTALGAADIPDEEKGMLVMKIVDLAQGRVLIDAMEELSEEDRQALDKLANADESVAIEAFLLEKFPDYTTRLEKAIAEVRDKLLAEFSA